MRDVNMVSSKAVPMDDGQARFIVLDLEIHLCWNVLKKKKQDRPSNPHRVLSLWWSNHLDLIVSGDNSVGFFVMRSLISWNMVVLLGNTTLAYKFTRMSTSHFITFWKEVSWIL